MLPVILGIAGVAGIIIAVIAVSAAMERKRTAAVGAIAESMGLEFQPADDQVLRDRMSVLPLFQQGHSRALTNCLSGDSGEVRISIFDYTYTTGHGKHQNKRNITTCALQSPRLQLPAFSMRPETLLDAIGGMLGFQDIDFEGDEAFSRAYVLKGPDEAAVRELFTAPLRKHFAGLPGHYVEGAGDLLIVHQSKRLPPAGYPQLLEQAYAVFGLLVDR